MDVQTILRTELTRCMNDIKRRHVQAGQRATGRTMNALEVRIRAEGQAIIGELWGNKYTGTWETGSRPARRRGTEASSRRMVEELKQWAEIRGLTAGMTEKQKENLAKYLAWYIKRYGTKLYREGGRRDIITPAIDATKKILAEQLAVFYEQEIENNFFGKQN